MSKTISEDVSTVAAPTWLRITLIWTFWLAPWLWWSAMAADGVGTKETAIPLWKQGISTWSGNQSTPNLPPPPTTTVVASDAPSPYSMPVDPNLYTNPVLAEASGFLVPPAATKSVPQPNADTPDAVTPIAETPAMDLSPSTRAVVREPKSMADGTIELTGHQPRISTPPATMSDLMQSDVVLEEPPLHQETMQWYQYPWRWMTTGWKNHAEFGLDGSRGNAQTLAMQVGAEMKRKTDLYTLAFDVDYRLANNRDTTTENNGRYNIDYDRLLNGSPWSLFGKYGMEWDQFKTFDLRLNLNGGLGYHWIRNDDTTLVTRFGSGASREFGAPIDEWTPEAVFGIEGEHQYNKYNKFKAKVDYFPAWEDFNDYRVVTDFGWEILLDDADNLSLKFAVTDRYDSTPQGAEPNDLYYSVLMLVKF